MSELIMQMGVVFGGASALAPLGELGVPVHHDPVEALERVFRGDETLRSYLHIC